MANDLVLAQLFDALPDGVTYCEALRDGANQLVDFRVTHVNAKGQLIAGTTYQHGVGTRLLGDNKHDRPFTEMLFDQYAEVCRTGQTKEYTYQHPNGPRLVTVIRSKVGDGVLSVIRDPQDQHRLTPERAQTERDARRMADENGRQADLLRDMTDSAINGIVACSAVKDEAGVVVDFRLTRINRAGERIARTSAGASVGKLLRTRLPGIEPFFAACRETYLTGQPRYIEAFYQDDGRRGWFEASSVPFADGVVVTFVETTEVRQARQAIEQAMARLQVIIDTVPSTIFMLSPVRDPADGSVMDFRVTMANRAFGAYVHREPQELIGALGSKHFPGYRAKGLFDRYRQTYETGQSQRFTVHYDVDGMNNWLDVQATKLTDQVLVTTTDFTSLQEAQTTLETTIQTLRRSNHSLEQFAFIASHDLQEPLRKIAGFGNIVQQRWGTALGADGADLIGRMQSAAGRMQTLVSDLLAYSRLSTRPEAMQPVDMNKLMAGVLADLEAAITDQRAIVTVQGMARLTGDPVQLRQLFQNLLSNALKFVRTDGAGAPVQPRVSVTCRTLNGHEAVMPLPESAHNRRFDLIEVTDNGIGFAPDQAERIFEVFERLHGRSAYTGTGIGLAIVRKVIDNHRGYIAAEGRPGAGATFRILLPTGESGQ